MFRESVHKSKRLRMQETEKCVIVFDDTKNPHRRNPRIYADMQKAEKAEGFRKIDLELIEKVNQEGRKQG